MSEKKYEAHPTDEGKYQSTFDEYGHGEGNGKAKQTINRRWKKFELPKVEFELIEDEVEKVEAPAHEWLDVGEIVEGDSVLSELPSASRSILKMLNSQNDEMTPSQKIVFRKQQAKLVRHGFSGILDPLLSVYCKGVVGKERAKDFEIIRTADDWILFEGVTENWLEYHDLTIPINPDLMMLGTIGLFYVPPVAKAHKNRDPSRLGIIGKVKGRFLSWRAKRKLKKMGVEEFEL